MRTDRARRLSAMLLTALLASACATTAPGPSDTLPAMNDAAERYVKLVLAVGQHDKDYVDAFYGPEEWKTEAEAGKRPLDAIAADAARLIAGLEKVQEPSDETLRLRRTSLVRQLQALAARVEMLGGKRFSFDEESRALYDAVAPVNTEGHFRGVRDELDRALPAGGGGATLLERYEAFRKDFTIPKDKVDAVFRTAVGECRER